MTLILYRQVSSEVVPTNVATDATVSRLTRINCNGRLRFGIKVTAGRGNLDMCMPAFGKSKPPPSFVITTRVISAKRGAPAVSLPKSRKVTHVLNIQSVGFHARVKFSYT